MHQQRGPVRVGLGHGRLAYGAACAGAVLNDHGLSDLRGKPLHHRARDDVGAAPWSKGHDNAHGFRRPGLRRGETVKGAQRERGDPQRRMPSHLPSFTTLSRMWISLTTLLSFFTSSPIASFPIFPDRASLE